MLGGDESVSEALAELKQAPQQDETKVAEDSISRQATTNNGRWNPSDELQ
jgi:hypothetical protein